MERQPQPRYVSEQRLGAFGMVLRARVCPVPHVTGAPSDTTICRVCDGADREGVIDDVIDSGVDESQKIGSRRPASIPLPPYRLPAPVIAVSATGVSITRQNRSLLQANRSAKDATVDTDIFAEQYNARSCAIS